ncbi:hypothetical protein BU25DRAFT_458519 [Macroventuria anomochaeta]|uniref:Uncharacterized protein n=1 Tax=Macroventuria anomochaeta TaxID=301207 RepID=A0ACB6S0Y8_9PLEO|nr:uncharacterized protein BU25DRAFT_458519 [Macroventuria anomochaeta]KAF2627632.1 hypothetical protein BU25DRAFT_458519 [Macroventuria anomochaeta]
MFNPISNKLEGWIVNIPGHGTLNRWTTDDEYMLTQEVETVRLITTKRVWLPYIVINELSGELAFENRDGLDDEELPTPTKDIKLTEDQVETLGTSTFLDIVFSHPVFHTTPEDTFALRHSDLDWQNILIDNSGNVTGVLDWDASLAMPCCVGHAAVPAFFDCDFYPKSIVNTPFVCWRAGHYPAFAALYEGGDKEDFMTRASKEIPGLQIDVWTVKFLLAKGCKKTEEVLKTELWKGLDPEMPPDGLLGEVEKQHAEAAVQIWMDDFAMFPLNGDDEA